MVVEVDKRIIDRFYNHFSKTSTFLLFFMIVSTLGFYFLNWIYQLNKRFEFIGYDGAPDSKRGAVILFFLPVFWILFMIVVRILIFPDWVWLKYLDVIVWFLIMFLALRYLYDFCKAFGVFTVSNGFVWYMFLWVGFFPIILLPLGIFYFWPILFFPIVTVCLMQRKLNENFDKLVLRDKNDMYLMSGRKY